MRGVRLVAGWGMVAVCTPINRLTWRASLPPTRAVAALTGAPVCICVTSSHSLKALCAATARERCVGVSVAVAVAVVVTCRRSESTTHATITTTVCDTLLFIVACFCVQSFCARAGDSTYGSACYTLQWHDPSGVVKKTTRHGLCVCGSTVTGCGGWKLAGRTSVDLVKILRFALVNFNKLMIIDQEYAVSKQMGEIHQKKNRCSTTTPLMRHLSLALVAVVLCVVQVHAYPLRNDILAGYDPEPGMRVAIGQQSHTPFNCMRNTPANAPRCCITYRVGEASSC